MNESLLNELADQPVKSQNAIKLKAYLTAHVKQGFRLPSLQDRPEINKSELASRCDFDRQGLDEQRGAKDTLRLLKWAVEKIGLDSISDQETQARQQSNPDVAILKKVIARQDKKILNLTESLDSLALKNNALSYRIKQLKKQLIQFEAADSRISNGYKIVLFEDNTERP